MDDADSKPDGRDDGDRLRGLDMAERDRALTIIAQEIHGYLETHREGDLEQIEMRMMSYLATVGQCAAKD